MKTIYTDNNATTMVAPEVLEEMLPYFSELYGNPSSMHSFGGNVGQKLKEARQKVADLIHADPGEIVFTSCAARVTMPLFYRPWQPIRIKNRSSPRRWNILR